MKNDTPNKTIYIVAGLIVLALVVGTTAYLTMMDKNSSDDTSAMDNSDTTSMMQEETVMVGGAAMYANRNIIDNVVNAPNLTTLVAAVQAADLVETLKGDGPFTVFGPDNDAFKKLPAGTVEELVKPENKETLTKILTYHVVLGKYQIADLKDGQRLTTVQGDDLVVYKQGAITTVNGAVIKTPDVLQSNGVAHVIDTVLLPPADTTEVGGAAMMRSKNIAENVVNAPNLTTLVQAASSAGLVEALQAETDITVFGPDNNAFAKVPASVLNNLLLPENKTSLTGVLTYHIVAGTYSVEQLYDGQTLTTLNGQTLTVQKKGSKTMIIGSTPDNVATIITPNVYQKNGVAHVIDTVLLPASN